MRGFSTVLGFVRDAARMALVATFAGMLVTPWTAAQTIANAGFESPSYTGAEDRYMLNPGGASWVFTGPSGIRRFSLPDGTTGRQAGFLTGTADLGVGAMEQTVNFSNGGMWRIIFRAAGGLNTGAGVPFRVLLDGVQIGYDIKPQTRPQFLLYWSQVFAASAGNHVLRFEATSTDGDLATNYVTLIDQVAIVGDQNVFANPSFEAPVNGGLRPIGYGWTFGGNAGIQKNFGYSDTADGLQYAYVSNSPTGNRQWFGGKALDIDTGLSYFGARYYDPALGRFMGVDPKGADPGDVHSFNQYVYANHNPYKYVDPDGRFAIAVLAAAFVAYELSPASMPKPPAHAPDAIYSSIGPLDVAGAAAGLRAIAAAGAVRLSAAAEEISSAASQATATIARTIQLSRGRFGEAAEHARDAIAGGKPDILTIERGSADANRAASTGGLAKVPGKQLDEYPPAMFREGGNGASVRAIDPRDNMSSGAYIGNCCRGLPNGATVKIEPTE